jgi:hypothetical protein
MRLFLRRELTLCTFAGSAETAKSSSILGDPSIGDILPFSPEFIDEVIDKTVIKIFAAEMIVSPIFFQP